jgi:hypothetical protein
MLKLRWAETFELILRSKRGLWLITSNGVTRTQPVAELRGLMLTFLSEKILNYVNGKGREIR